MRESYIEKKVTEHAVSKGWLSYKFSSPARRAVPDRIYFKKGRVKLGEFKATGKKATKAQRYEHEKLRAQGIEVHVIDNIEEGIALFQ